MTITFNDEYCYEMFLQLCRQEHIVTVGDLVDYSVIFPSYKLRQVGELLTLVGLAKESH
jgi:hypothetical protein